MGQQEAIDIVQAGLRTVLLTAAPPLGMGLIVGLFISIFQTVTSIQDQTLTFVPKILAVLLSIIIFGPFMMSTVMDFMEILYGNLANYVR